MVIFYFYDYGCRFLKKIEVLSFLEEFLKLKMSFKKSAIEIKKIKNSHIKDQGQLYYEKKSF